jgi:hypothetical protein
MSVIIESQPGDGLICIEAFSGPPQGERPSPETNRTFRVGERVRFAGAYRDEHFKDHPVGWMVVFDAADGKRYAATQTYFVTEQCWRGLKKFFAKRLLREPKRPEVSSPQPRALP